MLGAMTPFTTRCQGLRPSTTSAEGLLRDLNSTEVASAGLCRHPFDLSDPKKNARLRDTPRRHDCQRRVNSANGRKFGTAAST